VIVLFIVGFIALIIVLFRVVFWINEFSETNYNYEFFSWGNLGITSVGYLLLFYGNKWFDIALSGAGDISNGLLLMAMGLILVSKILYTHIKQTNLLFGVVVGTFQLILYIPLSVISIFSLFAGAAWLTEAKPVYKL